MNSERHSQTEKNEAGPCDWAIQTQVLLVWRSLVVEELSFLIKLAQESSNRRFDPDSPQTDAGGKLNTEYPYPYKKGTSLWGSTSVRFRQLTM